MVGQGKKMEIKIDKNRNLLIKHKLKKNETYRVSESSKFKSVNIFKKPQLVGGFSNQTEDTWGILTIDYDNVNLNVVLEDWKLIQKRFRLPPAYLFKTKEGNYHVICLRRFLNATIHSILQYTRCDENYLSMPLRNPNRSYVLRLSDKKGSKRPTFEGEIGEYKNLLYKISTAHKRLLSKLYPKIKHPKYIVEDGLKIVKLQRYETHA